MFFKTQGHFSSQGPSMRDDWETSFKKNIVNHLLHWLNVTIYTLYLNWDKRRQNIFLELSLHFEMTIIVSLFHHIFKIIVTIGSVVQYWSSDYLYVPSLSALKKKLYRAHQILRERESRTEPDWWNPPPWEDLSGNQLCHLWWVSQSSISLIDVRPLVRPKPHGHGLSGPDLVMGCSIVLDIDMAMNVLRHFQHYVVASWRSVCLIRDTGKKELTWSKSHYHIYKLYRVYLIMGTVCTSSLDINQATKSDVQVRPQRHQNNIFFLNTCIFNPDYANGQIQSEPPNIFYFRFWSLSFIPK